MLRHSLFAAALLSLLACGGEPKKAEGEAAPAVVAAEQDIGYDLRRLRPRNDETLEAMFGRMREGALAEGKRVAVLFSADWCEPCRILDAELGNRHPASQIGDVRILEIKEEDWQGATRMDEFNALRERWTDINGSYPFFVLLDPKGQKIEEMKEAKERLEAKGVEPTLAAWFAEGRTEAAS